MSLLINSGVAIFIIGGALITLYRHLRRSKKGKCPACEYNCPAKQRLNRHSPH